MLVNVGWVAVAGIAYIVGSLFSGKLGFHYRRCI